MVEKVEELSPEIHRHALAIGQQEMLDQGQIRIDEVRSVQRSTIRVPQFSARRAGEALGVEKLGERPTAARRAELVGTVEIVSVVGEIHAGTTVAVDEEHWESRR